jgi:hypothetical protein
LIIPMGSTAGEAGPPALYQRTRRPSDTSR